MKVTEQQLKTLFQNSTLNQGSDVMASDCLASREASSVRLQHAESLLNDHTSAQAMKLSLALKPWASQVAADIKSQSAASWFDWVSHPFKATLTASAMALALVLVVPQLNKQEQQWVPAQQSQSDVIMSVPFESDVLKSGSFEGQPDSLFGATFG